MNFASISLVPEDEVVGELADGVIAFAVGPPGLLGGEAFDRGVAGDEPVLDVVRGVKLLEKNALEGGGRRLGCGRLGGGGEGVKTEGEGKDEDDSFHVRGTSSEDDLRTYR